MALTGKFIADFESFYSAVQKAEVSLRGFEGNANKVGSALNRMTDQFSGRKLIQDATLMSEAVDRIGGTSKLTKSELERVANQAKEATDKMRALGVEIPPHLDNLASKAGGVEKSWRAAGAALGAAFSVAQITSAAANVGRTASHIQDLADKAGISTEAVQKLDFVAKQTGSTFDEISGAIAQMSNRLVEGDKSAVAGLERMGLSVSTLRSLSPDKAFEEIAAAIAKVPDPMEQSKLAMDLFGKSGAQLLPTLKADIEGLSAAAPIMGDEMVKAGDKFDDSMAKVQARLDVLKAQSLLPVLEVFDALPGSVQTGVAAFVGLLPTITSVTSAFALIVGPGAIGAAVATFFTTTLPAAFAAVVPFLGPVGIIAAGVAAVVIAWKNWDTIVGFVKGVYEGVKTWMVDKFNAIVDSIKAKVDAVTGFFKGMYDSVVGHSYVPDMIAGIAAEFGRLDKIMENPAKAATERVAGLFEGLTNKISGLLGGKDSTFGKIMNSGLGSLFAAGGPLMSLVGTGMDALGGLVMKGVQKIGGWIKGIFTGGEEGSVVNPARDAWFAGRGVQDIGDELGKFGIDGETARQMIDRVFKSRTKSDFDRASSDIDKILRGGGFTGPSFANGTGGRYLNFGSGTLAMLHGREKITPMGQGGSEQPLHIHVNVDGREIAWALVPHLPDAQAALA